MKQYLIILFFISASLLESVSAQITRKISNSDGQGSIIIRHEYSDASSMLERMTSDTVYDFGDLPVMTSQVYSFTLFNTGSDTLIIFDIQNHHPAFFVGGKIDFIPKNRNREITVTFTPKETGSCVDTLVIYSDDPDKSFLEVILTGNGVSPTQDELPVSVLPNPFTPNGDGFNDWAEFIFSENDIQEPLIQIFSLRGEKICELNSDTGNGYRWNGKDDSGCDAEPGVYIYIFTPKDNPASNGSITLIR